MADTTTALPSQTEPVVDRYRRWSPIWYPWIKKILETVRTQADSIFQINQVVDELEGKWTVDITEGGKVRGAVRLDASEVLSEFNVLADIFKVSLPDGTGEKTVFAIGTVNSVTGQAGFSPLLFLDGSILARHLDVESLSAITADIGTLTTGKIQSEDGKFLIDATNKRIVITT